MKEGLRTESAHVERDVWVVGGTMTDSWPPEIGAGCEQGTLSEVSSAMTFWEKYRENHPTIHDREERLSGRSRVVIIGVAALACWAPVCYALYEWGQNILNFLHPFLVALLI